MEGFEVEVASDGEDALKKVDQFSPDLLLLDLILPLKDGLQVLQELRSNPKWEGLPVIISSGLIQQKDKDTLSSLGVSEFLTKTESSLDDLVLKIKTMLNS